MQPTRKARGAWYTPPELIATVIDGLFAEIDADRTAPVHRHGSGAIRVLDPAAGDGRLLRAVAASLAGRGVRHELIGCDIDAAALAAAGLPDARLIHDDALARDWGDERFDVVIGNPPFLSQMAAGTTRGGASRHGGGPYADAAAEFLALAVRLARPDGGRVALVLPQSILGARDAGPVREAVAGQADLRWSWWEPRQQHFDAAVNVCVLGFARPSTGAAPVWTRVVTDRLGVPALDQRELRTTGRLGDRGDLNANFRDEYYALVPAVADGADGPPLVTSGLIDPGVCHWGDRSVTFAKQTFTHPRVELSRLTGRFPAWAARKLVPKVLVANQTRIIEAVADPTGAWLPGVPVTTVTPHDGAAPERALWEIAAVLTAPVASVLAWHAGAGTGLSTRSVRVGPAVLAATPWPAGDLAKAVEALRSGDLVGCAREVTAAYGLIGTAADRLVDWWVGLLPS
ncbi:MAG TPA: N-6 DNA methylase [Ilumatobacter sp.]